MKLSDIHIKKTTPEDFDNIMSVEKAAFGYDKEAKLVADLLQDDSAEPMLSLLAFFGKDPVGHILFTRATFREQESTPLMHILAPLAVIPEYQNQGIGGLLIEAGMQMLEQMGSKLVFVLGHKEYYPKFGFVPYAARLGYLPPYPMPEANDAYWMVRNFEPDGMDIGKGVVVCADTLNKPEHWRDDEADR